MELLEIKTMPDEILRAFCEDISEMDGEWAKLLADMEWTMRIKKGIGLAAPQVGIAKNLIIATDGSAVCYKLANPKILFSEQSETMVEGCLSLPSENVEVERAAKITIAALDCDNREIEFDAEGLLARVLLHEIDHLYGKLIIDYRRV